MLLPPGRWHTGVTGTPRNRTAREARPPGARALWLLQPPGGREAEAATVERLISRHDSPWPKIRTPWLGRTSQEGGHEGVPRGSQGSRGHGTHLLLLIEALPVTVGDVDAPGAEHIQELEPVQCVLHLPAAGPLWGSGGLQGARVAPRGTRQVMPTPPTVAPRGGGHTRHSATRQTKQAPPLRRALEVLEPVSLYLDPRDLPAAGRAGPSHARRAHAPQPCAPSACRLPPARRGAHIFRLPLVLGGEVLGVGALGLVVHLVALAVLGVPLLDDVHLRVQGLQLGVGHPVRAGQGLRAPRVVVLLRLAAVSLKGARGTRVARPSTVSGGLFRISPLGPSPGCTAMPSGNAT